MTNIGVARNVQLLVNGSDITYWVTSICTNAICDADNPCKGNKMETANITIRKEITQDELWKINAKHDTWLHDNTKGERACFDRAFLYGLNLSDMNLSYATFIDSNIAKCNMQDSIMIETNFSNSRLSDINARDANFDSANFTRANIVDTNLSGANFSNAIFNKVLFGNVNFAYANLTNANFFGAFFENVNISYTSFNNSNLIIGGYDSRGYLFYSYQRPDGGVTVRAGCRTFYNMEDAYSHWETRHPYNPSLKEEIMGNLDKIERVAKVRGWL